MLELIWSIEYSENKTDVGRCFMDDDLVRKGGDRRDYYGWIGRTLEDFYNSFYREEMLKFYSFFDTEFQRKIPLNVFLNSPSYNLIQLGRFISILDMELSKKKNEARVKMQLDEDGNIVTVYINMKKEFGDWKIIGENFF